MADSRDGFRGKKMSRAIYSVKKPSKYSWKKQKGSCFNSIYTKIGKIQRRFSWPRTDDKQISEAFHVFANFMLRIFYQNKQKNEVTSKAHRSQLKELQRAKTETMGL